MNINDFVRNSTAGYLYGSSGTSASANSLGGAARLGLDKANQRIQSLVDTNTAQLSTVGKLKSSVSSLQISAQALGKLASNSTNAENKTAANNLVKAFNDAAATAKSNAKDPGEPAAYQSATRVGKDLQRAVTADATTAAALKKIGASVSAEGKLVIDTAKWDAAQLSDPSGIRASLVKIGQQLDNTATQELAVSGNVGSAVASLTQSNTLLKNQQATLTALQTPPTASASSRYGPFGAGLSAYQNS